MMEKKQRILVDIFLGVFLSSLIFSLVMYAIRNPQPRFVYYFHSFDTPKICTEVRHKPSSSSTIKNNEFINYFVEDLILGPMTNRYKYLFNPKTTLEFCFLDDKILNIGLSSEALKVHPEYSPIKEGVQLLKLNIVKNFTNIDKIYIYIDGQSVYEDE